MIITIISGGSGSENIQKGLKNICPELELNLIINGYDDGKSTGLIRKVFHNTLGISDFRKNQLLEYGIITKKNNIYKLLNSRFTSDTPYDYILQLFETHNIKNIDNDLYLFLLDNVNYFFQTEESRQIKYDDFSFMNIIYCALLKKNDNNMENVCNIIKSQLNLKNNIYLNANENLILKGITKNNIILENEESIVNYSPNNNDDKIVDIFFSTNFESMSNRTSDIDNKNIQIDIQDNVPRLNKNTEELLLKSDIIIFSCGTQFSSLIPTYKTLNFKETIKKSNAKKYLILNADYDKDIINYSGDELLDKINEYISICSSMENNHTINDINITEDVKIIISDDMNSKLLPTCEKYSYINIPKLLKNGLHDGDILCKYILIDFFGNYFTPFHTHFLSINQPNECEKLTGLRILDAQICNNKYIFDYDYTLYDPNYINISKENIKLLEKINDNSVVISNNCLSNIEIDTNKIVLYSNMGNIKTYKNISKIINEEYLLDNNDIEYIFKTLKYYNEYEKTKSDNKLCIPEIPINRKNISVSIKPVSNIDSVIENLKKWFALYSEFSYNWNNFENNIYTTSDKENNRIKIDHNCKKYDIIKNGKTTIEIIKSKLTKRNVFISEGYLSEINKNEYTYISDTNDINYNKYTDNIKYFETSDVVMTNLFLKTVIINKKYDFCISVGGINSRFELNYPKCLVNINDEILLENTLNKLLPYANNIYVCCCNYYYSHFKNFENKIKNENIHFIYLDSIDGSKNFPKGNGETIYQFLEKIKVTDKLFILWGDIFIKNNKIFEEMYNLYKGEDILIPVIYEENPYAYLYIENNKVKSIKYKKYENIDYGYHDQCIFLCDTKKIKSALNILINLKYDELNFLNIIDNLDSIEWYETTHNIYSFNTEKEYKELFY